MLCFNGLFQDWEIAIVTKLVDDYIQQWRCLRRGDFEDILLECLSHWCMVRGTYSPNRKASPKTYMGVVIRNKLLDIVSRETTDLREIRQHTVSFEKKMGNNEDSPSLLDQLISSPSAETKYDPCTDIDKRIDICTIMGSLNPRQKILCEWLMSGDFTMTEISECLETPRSTMIDERNRIRRIFEDAGLKDYLS